MKPLTLVLLVVFALIVGVMFAVYRRRRRRRLPAPRRELPAPFELELGDVVVVAGRELWLESGWALAEGARPVGSVFFSDGGIVVELLGRPLPLYLTDPVAELEAATLPPTVHHAGVAYERISRLPVRVRPLGDAPPIASSAARLGEYQSAAGATLFVLAFEGAARVLLGSPIEARDFERFGGGRSTLDR